MSIRQPGVPEPAAIGAGSCGRAASWPRRRRIWRSEPPRLAGLPITLAGPIGDEAYFERAASVRSCAATTSGGSDHCLPPASPICSERRVGVVSPPTVLSRGPRCWRVGCRWQRSPWRDSRVRATARGCAGRPATSARSPRRFSGRIHCRRHRAPSSPSRAVTVLDGGPLRNGLSRHRQAHVAGGRDDRSVLRPREAGAIAGLPVLTLGVRAAGHNPELEIGGRCAGGTSLEHLRERDHSTGGRTCANETDRELLCSRSDRRRDRHVGAPSDAVTVYLTAVTEIATNAFESHEREPTNRWS